jgi:hypothetical protein
MSKPQRFIAAVVTTFQDNGHPIKHVKMDSQLNKSDVTAYLDSIHVTYQFTPPYEHEFIGKIERNNRTAQNTLCFSNICNKNKIIMVIFSLGHYCET